MKEVLSNYIVTTPDNCAGSPIVFKGNPINIIVDYSKPELIKMLQEEEVLNIIQDYEEHSDGGHEPNGVKFFRSQKDFENELNDIFEYLCKLYIMNFGVHEFN